MQQNIHKDTWSRHFLSEGGRRTTHDISTGIYACTCVSDKREEALGRRNTQRKAVSENKTEKNPICLFPLMFSLGFKEFFHTIAFLETSREVK